MRSFAYSSGWRISKGTANYRPGSPAHTRTQMSDVRDVVAGVPAVRQRDLVEALQAALGVLVGAGELLVGHALDQQHPAGVDGLDQFQRPLDGAMRVGQQGEGVLVVAGDDRIVFGEGLLEAMERGGVRVRDVVHHLTDRPSAFAIRRVELVEVQLAHGFTQLLRHLRDGKDRVAAVLDGDFVGLRLAAYGVARVLRLDKGGHAPIVTAKIDYTAEMLRIPRLASLLFLSTALLSGCGRSQVETPPEKAQAAVQPEQHPGLVNGEYRGFDRNGYPGDGAMAELHKQFAFTGYWLTVPPGAKTNSWVGKRAVLRAQGWGFLLLANGRLDREIVKAQKAGTAPAELGRKDAAVAVAAAKAEGFPAGATIFLDQEEGGRLLEEQAGYLLGWTEAVATGAYKPGVYASGQPVSDEPGTTIDTIRDIRARVKAGKLHEIAMFDAQDACPPSAGCTVQAKPLNTAGEPDLTAWQYSQSPRRTGITKSCAVTYASDGNCYAPGVPGVFLDMDSAREADPSHGR